MNNGSIWTATRRLLVAGAAVCVLQAAVSIPAAAAASAGEAKVSLSGATGSDGAPSMGQRDRDRDREDVDRIIRQAYRDILKRDPDAEGMRTYRREMLQNGWSEQDLRKALRKSAERDAVKEKEAEKTVRRLYQDILGRPADPQGLREFRDHMVFDRWSERQVREALMNSREYKDKNGTRRR
ncbi:MAG: hypothetical protein WCP29_18975 [Acidobacteriota bacterium]